MDSQITIKLVQDINWWTLGIQALAAIAVIIAAGVAGFYQRNKEKRHKRKMEVYFCALLKQLKSQVETFLFLGVADGYINQETYVALMKEIKSSNDQISGYFLEIVEYCPREVIEKIHLVQMQVRTIILDLGDFNDFSNHFDDSMSLTRLTWKKVWPSLDESIELIGKDLKPFIIRNILLANYRRKLRKSVKEDQSIGV